MVYDPFSGVEYSVDTPRGLLVKENNDSCELCPEGKVRYYTKDNKKDRCVGNESRLARTNKNTKKRMEYCKQYYKFKYDSENKPFFEKALDIKFKAPDGKSIKLRNIFPQESQKSINSIEKKGVDWKKVGIFTAGILSVISILAHSLLKDTPKAQIPGILQKKFSFVPGSIILTIMKLINPEVVAEIAKNGIKDPGVILTIGYNAISHWLINTKKPNNQGPGKGPIDLVKLNVNIPQQHIQNKIVNLRVSRDSSLPEEYPFLERVNGGFKFNLSDFGLYNENIGNNLQIRFDPEEVILLIPEKVVKDLFPKKINQQFTYFQMNKDKFFEVNILQIYNKNKSPSNKIDMIKTLFKTKINYYKGIIDKLNQKTKELVKIKQLRKKKEELTIKLNFLIENQNILLQEKGSPKSKQKNDELRFKVSKKLEEINSELKKIKDTNINTEINKEIVKETKQLQTVIEYLEELLKSTDNTNYNINKLILKESDTLIKEKINEIKNPRNNLEIPGMVPFAATTNLFG